MRRFQSPEFLQIVTIVTRSLDVVAKSVPYNCHIVNIKDRFLDTCQINDVPYLSCLFFEHQQLVDRTLNVGLSESASAPIQHRGHFILNKPLQATPPPESTCQHPYCSPSRV